MITAVAVGKLYGLHLLSKFIVENPIESCKISIISFGLCSSWDSYYCLIYIWKAMQFNLELFPVAFLYAFLFIHSMRCIIILWEPRYYHLYHNNRDAKIGLLKYILKLYVLLFGGMVLIYFFNLNDWFVFAMYFFYLPQIIHSAIRGQALQFMPGIIGFYYATRLIYPVFQISI